MEKMIGQRASQNLTASGDNVAIAADPSKRIYVWQFFLVNAHATTDVSIVLKEGTTVISGAYLLKAAGGAHSESYTGMPWAICPVNTAFNINLSATSSVQGTVYFTYEQP